MNVWRIAQYVVFVEEEIGTKASRLVLEDVLLQNLWTKLLQILHLIADVQ